MNKKIIIASSIIAACIIAVVFLHFADISKSEYRYTSIQTALKEGIKAERASYYPQMTQDEKNTDIDLEEFIVLETEYQEAHYYIVKIPYVENNLHKDDAFIAKITTKWNKYKYEKCTAQFALNTPGAVPDIEYTPYAHYEIEVGDLFFAVGKIYDKNYRPYLNGKPLSVDDEGIYAAVSEKAKPEIEVSSNK